VKEGHAGFVGLGILQLGQGLNGEPVGIARPATLGGVEGEDMNIVKEYLFYALSRPLGPSSLIKTHL